jgi:uncharacterized phage-associated protein
MVMPAAMSALTLATQIDRKYNVYGAMQLQKLLYYAEAWAQVLGDTLFYDNIEAWDNGPVVREVFTTYKYYTLSSEPAISSPARTQLLESVIPFYNNRGGADLSEQTHNESPWVDAYAQGRNTVISRSAMRKFYARQALLEPDKVPELPSISIERLDADTVAKRAQEINQKWERTLAILGS